MPAGRPTKFTPELTDKLEEYINKCKDKDKDGKEQTPLDNVPCAAGFSLYADINPNTLDKWLYSKDLQGEHYEGLSEFRRMFKKLKALQELTMLNHGANGRCNSAIAKLVLAKHGYTDKVDVTTDGEQINAGIMFFSPKNDDNE